MPGPTELMLLLVLLVVAGVVLAFLSRSRRQNSEGSDDARRVLDERYARGELDRDEYQQMRRDMES